MIDEESARKELSGLSENTRKYLGWKLGTQITNIKLTNELDVMDPMNRRKGIGQSLSEIGREVNRLYLFL